jgi:hypothetical protein
MERLGLAVEGFADGIQRHYDDETERQGGAVNLGEGE